MLRPYINSDYRLPKLSDISSMMRHLKVYGNIEAPNWRKKGRWRIQDLYALYALSRVSDILLLPFQTGSYDIKSVPRISLEERSEYFIQLGMEPIKQTTFHPFFHEIVEVVQSLDPLEPISLVEIIWPGFMLGNMMFCRAGVKVCGGSNYINKVIAEKSILYFAHRRRNRPVKDLLVGWGHNSQWATRFRRDYQDDSAYYYNVDGSRNLIITNRKARLSKFRTQVLTPVERLELLVNRCFIVTDKSPEELWPYYDRYTELKPLSRRSRSKS
jgi:hypothetical protein